MKRPTFYPGQRVRHKELGYEADVVTVRSPNLITIVRPFKPNTLTTVNASQIESIDTRDS